MPKKKLRWKDYFTPATEKEMMAERRKLHREAMKLSRKYTRKKGFWRKLFNPYVIPTFGKKRRR